MIIVTGAWRGRGIGGELRECDWELNGVRIPNLFLICSIDNVPAQRIYVRYGFRAAGLPDDLWWLVTGRYSTGDQLTVTTLMHDQHQVILLKRRFQIDCTEKSVPLAYVAVALIR